MKIKVLGTGSASDVHRSCGYLIDGKILVDVPNGGWKLVEQLGYPRQDINDILLTHYHADHCFDLPFVYISRMKSMTMLNIYCGDSGRQRMDILLRAGYEDLLEIFSRIPVTYISADEFQVQNYNVRRFPVYHKALPECYAYVFDDGEKKVGFSGDSSFCEGLLEAVKGCSHFICECTKTDPPIPRKDPGHVRVSEFLAMAMANPQCMFYSTHMNPGSRAELMKCKLPNVVVLDDLDDLEF